MQVSTSLQTDMQVAVAQFFTGPMPFLSPNQQRQSTEGKCTLMYIKQKMQNDISTNHHIQNLQIRNSSLADTSGKIHASSNTICHQAAQYTSCSFGNIFATNRTKIIDLHNSEVSQ